MEKTINYYTPDFAMGYPIYKKLFSLWKEFPYIFRENVKISHIFGAFPNMIWNGGSYCLQAPFNLELVKEIRDYFNDENINLQLTFTNPLITKETECYDTYCNLILELFDNGKNKVLVTSPTLEAYIRKNYPNYKIDKSIITTKDLSLDYNKELEKYDRVVLSRRLLNNFDYLSHNIKEENRSRVEILANELCPIDCPRLYTHYEHLAQVQKYLCSPIECELSSCTNNQKSRYEWNRSEKQMVLSYNDIVRDYLPLGYTEFKLSGRWNHLNIISSLIPYLIKEEYQIEMFKVLTEEVIKT